MTQQINKLENAMTDIRAEASLADKRAEYALSLYNKITNITWNYDNNNQLAGCKYYILFSFMLANILIMHIIVIGSNKSKSFKKFAYDISSNNTVSMDTSNQLWNTIEASIV